MEALTMVGGAVLAPLFESLLGDLRSGHVLNYARKKGVLKELQKWEETLKTIKVVLEKAEEQQRTADPVKIWFNDLQNLAYDVEDILDEFNTKAMVESKAGTSKIKKMISSSLARFTFVSTAETKNISDEELKNISERLQHIKEGMEYLKLSVEGSKSGVRDNATFTLTSSLVNEAHVYGREEDRKKILNQLKAESGDGRTPVIPVVGMGGVGKTTLAQLIYNDDNLQFDFKAWVTIGDDFNVLTITRTILRQLGGGDQEDFVSLQAKLKEKLCGKKSLVVLDDVWTKDYAKWDLFYKPFETGSPRSRIIVTTRDKHVSLMASRAAGYPLGELSDDDCLSIVAYHALGRKNFNEHPDLREAGEGIARKCDGLPLAARALGGALRGKEDTISWEELLNSKIWEEETSVLPALKLSYYQLPPCLKRCFRYTSIFPKDYEFDRTRLVPLWMAEGFVVKMKDGYSYFDDLLARSFFRKSSSDESLYVMHDLMNDLARSVSGNICFNLDEEAEKSYAEVRHSAFNCREYDVASRFERFHEMKHLRTFMALRHGQPSYRRCYISTMALDDMIARLKYLRVLALPYAIRELPPSIGCLKHLRCLDISYAGIKMLPKSLCKLFNLKALILFKCRMLCKLPKDFSNLINLQFLDIRGADSLTEMPSHISDLKNLHILGKIVVGESDVGRMLELLKIPNLQGRQHISALQNAINVEDVDFWGMRKLVGIDALTLEWTGDSRNEKNEEEVLSALKPQKNIMELSIMSYGGRELPSWIGDPRFGKMKILRLSNSCNVTSLPALGQLPSLEELTLEGMRGIKQVGMEFYGSVVSSAKVFPSLKILIIKHMEELYEWSNYSIDEGRGHVFPKLKKLELNNCPKLEVCSLSFPNLDKLEVEGCKEVVLRSTSNLASLRELRIRRISGLKGLNGALLEALGSLQVMHVGNCDELNHLWEDEFNVEWLGCLKTLIIWDCKEVVSLLEEDERNFPLNLQNLMVSGCDKLKKLPNQLRSLTSLTFLAVAECPKLETFPTRGLPHSVKCVRLQKCDSLVSLTEGIIEEDNWNSGQRSQIEYLTIDGCNALILPSNLRFPASLRDLDIRKSPVEAQFFRSLQLQNGLTDLCIENCSNLESFPDITPPIPTLLVLRLRKCEKLRSLPNHLNQFTSLQTLQMYDCPQVASIPEGGMPTNLNELVISYCDKLERMVLLEQSLNSLACLKRLRIEVGGGMDDVYSFPHYPLMLPTSLTHLQIRGFQSLKSISSGIQTLTSLEGLRIGKCPKLQSLPRLALPSSLGYLLIENCPLLLTKGKGYFRPLVASIPLFGLEDYCFSYSDEGFYGLLAVPGRLLK